MFLRPFRVKSNTQLKTSDKKRLRLQLSQQFPALVDEEIQKLVPLKEDVSTSKLFCHKGEPVLVYLSGSQPIAISIESRVGPVLLPTVYFCWMYPDVPLAPVFCTSPDVLLRLQQGADLMMPGVIYSGPLTQTTFGQFEAGSPALVVSRGAVIAVGCTTLSSIDLYMAGGHGKAVYITHVVGDHLWAIGSKAMPPYADKGSSSASTPDADVSLSSAVMEASAPPTTPGSQDSSGGLSYSSVAGGGSASGGSGSAINDATPSEGGDGVDSLVQAVDTLEVQDQRQASPQVLSGEAMDDLLLHCFLKAVQQSKGNLPLPLLTSNFYRLHVLPACPDNASLDIKKTTYKKLSKFLKEMVEKQLITVTEHPKGIENITSVKYDHEDFTSFRYHKNETTKVVVEGGSVFQPPIMEEVYQVSGDTIQFFRACGRSKGEVLTRSEVRDIVTSYVKHKKLVDSATKLVNLEPPLHDAIIAPKEGLVRQMKWDQVFSRLLGRMAPAVRIQRPGFTDIVRKGKIEPIEMTVVKRSGNKKVTLIYNVHHYGIVEVELARQIQHLAAASTSVGPAEHKPQGTTQILVQGNAVADVAKLLLETYNIPKKYIKGLDLIPKGKKGKN